MNKKIPDMLLSDAPESDRDYNMVELHFIDGPLQGTRKMEHESTLRRQRTYRYLKPNSSFRETVVPVSTSKLDFVQVVCSEHKYVFIPLPSESHGTLRFAMLLESGI